jgi:D-tyrosyl-tRNA(Tyr) deacylase
MRVIIQRVTNAHVIVSEKVISKIDKGLLCLVGITEEDKKEDAEYMTRKILNIRLWDDNEGKRWAKSVMDMNYQVLLVSQFTLFSKLKGNKPDFHLAMNPKDSQPFFEEFVKQTKGMYGEVQTGMFGEYMQVGMEGDGPVTIVLDSKQRQ